MLVSNLLALFVCWSAAAVPVPSTTASILAETQEGNSTQDSSSRKLNTNQTSSAKQVTKNAEDVAQSLGSLNRRLFNPSDDHDHSGFNGPRWGKIIFPQDSDIRLNVFKRSSTSSCRHPNQKLCQVIYSMGQKRTFGMSPKLVSADMSENDGFPSENLGKESQNVPDDLLPASLSSGLEEIASELGDRKYLIDNVRLTRISNESEKTDDIHPADEKGIQTSRSTDRNSLFAAIAVLEQKLLLASKYEELKALTQKIYDKLDSLEQHEVDLVTDD